MNEKGCVVLVLAGTEDVANVGDLGPADTALELGDSRKREVVIDF